MFSCDWLDFAFELLVPVVPSKFESSVFICCFVVSLWSFWDAGREVFRLYLRACMALIGDAFS